MQPAKFHFKNIGPIKKAELELGDLTIISGRNNTGKTYLSYTLYGFLKQWNLKTRRMSRKIEEKLEKMIKEVLDEDIFKPTIDRETQNQNRKEIICDLAHFFSRENLADVFSSSRDAFAESSIEVELPGEFPKYAQTDNYPLRYSLPSTQDYRRFDYYCQLLFPELPFEPFIFSSERFSISLFYKELDFTKNQLVDLLQKKRDDKDRGRFSPYILIDKTTSRYALPTKNNIDYTRDISNLKIHRSELYKDKLFDNIKDMMEGYYNSSSDDIVFISKRKGRSFRIPLNIASSSARGLSDLYFYLRHVAWKNQLVIIDEPESHLDTANQIQLARLLTRMIQAGLKVLITTHSDYIIKEINNLIMLSKPFKGKNKVVRDLGYKKDDCIKRDSVRAYVAEGDSLTKCEIDDFGIDMPVFDETIDKINRASNELASRLAEEKDV